MRNSKEWRGKELKQRKFNPTKKSNFNQILIKWTIHCGWPDKTGTGAWWSIVVCTRLWPDIWISVRDAIKVLPCIWHLAIFSFWYFYNFYDLFPQKGSNHYSTKIALEHFNLIKIAFYSNREFLFFSS